MRTRPYLQGGSLTINFNHLYFEDLLASLQCVIFATVMKRLVVQKIYLLVFLLAGHAVQAQIKFSATIAPDQIGKNEYTQLRLVLENAKEVEQIVPPNLNNFIIVSGPNQESGMTMINGVVKKFVALNFILKPKSTGNFIIGGAQARADAGDYKTNAVKLKVTADASGNNSGSNVFGSPFGAMDPFAEPAPRSAYNDYILRKGENPADKIARNMQVRVEVDKRSVYVGEPVVATYKLYTRLKSESNMVRNPSFNGFSVLDLQQPNDMSYHTEKLDGREYNVYIIRKAQLYPLLPGNLDLGIAEIENKVQFIKAEYINQHADVFGNFNEAAIPPEGVEIQKVSLQSKPLSILVKPLPQVDKPAGFKGAVGNFSIETKIEKNNFSTDDAGNMAIIVSGEGNLQMVNAPEITWPAGIEGFDPKATDDLYKGTVPVSGRKIFEFPFTVAKAGNYSLPAAEFSFFDIREGKYKTIKAKPISFTVSKGTGKPKKIIADTKQEDNFLTKFFSNRLRVVSLIAVLIIFGLLIWLKRDTKKEKETGSKVAEEAVKMEEEKPVDEILAAQQNPLTLAEECLQREDARLFYTHLNLELKNFLAKKLAIAAEELTRKNIAEHLDLKGVSIETAVQLQQLIGEIEWQLYTPFADQEKMKDMYDRAHDLVQLLNSYVIKPK